MKVVLEAETGVLDLRWILNPNPRYTAEISHCEQFCDTGWRLGVVVSVVGRINEVNQHRARLVHDG